MKKLSAIKNPETLQLNVSRHYLEKTLKIKNLFVKYKIILIFGLFFFTAGYIFSGTKNIASFSKIESGFKTLPDSLKTTVYWYWLSDNISREGVVKDLQAMKRVGINRAFIGNIGLPNFPVGKVKIFSDEWWDILHTALKTATDLNIEIGIFNSPGWSQSGGPWVKKEQSMRFLNSSELKVSGPQKLSAKLIASGNDFQTVKVIAYKAPTSIEKTYRTLNPKLTSTPAINGLEKLIDGDTATIAILKNNKPVTITFETKEKATVRSLIIQTANKKIRAKGEAPARDGLKAMGELFVKDGLNFRSLKKFVINRSNFALNVGFEPNASIVISLPETQSTSYQLVISDITMVGALSEIELSETPKMERYPEKTLAKMFQTPLPYWKDYMWDVQPEVSKNLAIDSKSVLDITKNVSADGILNWSVPKGNWIIMQTGMTTTGVTNGPATPEGTGLETDKMSKKHIAAHFDAFLGEIIRRIPAADRKTWKVVVEDSYETGGLNWTDGMIEKFTSRYGYSPVPFLPAMKGNVVDSRDKSDRFLWDLRRMIADKVSYDYVGGLREISHQNGLTTWLENYGHWGFPGEFLQYGGQSDEIAGEFWSEGDLGNIENRAASSCGHIYGKTKISAESFTCGGKAYSRHPASMKQRGDRFFTEGINNTLLHLYIQQPDEREPGVNAWFSNEFNRHNTWFNYMDMFTQYLKRTNFMLQQGTYVADVAYFIGEDVPKMTGICDPALPKGYSFDYINAEVIMNRLSIKNGKLTLPDGLSYSILVLPKIETMRPELLTKIKKLVLQGAVILGPKPKYSPSLQAYPKADLQLNKMADELWGKVDGVNVKSAKVGKGMILSGMEMQEALNLVGVMPDCKFAKEDSTLFIHRIVAEGEVYFISNQTNKTISIDPEFRITGKSPELWNSVDAAMRDLPAFKQTQNTTIVPLKLEAYESQFVIFRKNATNSTNSELSANFPDSQTLVDLNQNWTVSFDLAKRGPRNSVSFKTLTDWTLSANDSIKYYSGTAIYRKSFDLNALCDGKKIFLNLGLLTSMAKVKLNGKDVGGVWTAPWRLDITSALKTGKNELEISVVNNWMNRLIGDLKIPVSERPTWTPIIPYTVESPLQSSGLFGPVSIQYFD